MYKFIQLDICQLELKSKFRLMCDRGIINS